MERDTQSIPVQSEVQQPRSTESVRILTIREILDQIRRDRISELNAKGYDGSLALGPRRRLPRR